MIFAHCSAIQEGEAVLFYQYSRKLNGYMVSGMLVAPGMQAKLAFAKIWTYFVSEVVQADDIYCSVVPGAANSMFDNYLTYHSKLDGLSIYKVDNFLKDKYSMFSKHLANKSRG